MFATNDLSRYTIMDKSKFIPHVDNEGDQVANIRSSITPDGPGTSEVYNVLTSALDPGIYLTGYPYDSIHVSNSHTGVRELLTGSFGGAGVFIRNSGGQSDAKCYTPAAVCSSGALAYFSNHQEVVEYSTIASTTLKSTSSL